MTAAAHGAEAVGPVETAVHRLAPQCKVAALLAFVVAVALVPYGHAWPYAIDAALLAAVVVASRTPPALLARRLVVEIPFIAFVLLLPFVAQGPQVDLLGVGVARDGLWAAGGIAAKATLAVLATGVLAATTPVPEIVAGLERLHAPRQLTAIGAFALRYLQLVLDELGRLRNARIARGDDPRWLWQARTAARCAGALAVRCLQRGERVHAAMLARGYDGRMPPTGLEAPARPWAWAAALALPAVAVAATIAVRGVGVTELHTIDSHAHVEIDEPPALLVVGHGTRDADGVEEFWALSRTIREVAGPLPVEFGFIEMAEPLADAAVDRLVERGLSDIVSVPLVLLAAGHLKNDGPATLARARQRHPGVRFRMGRDLGIDPVVLAVVEDRIRAAIGEDDPAEVAVVLVGRGSSDPDAGGDLFKFGRLLADGRGLGTVEPAFVSVAQPDVPGALERCRRLGARTVVVAPLLLFTGVLVPRIYRQAQDWAAEHPEVEVRGAAHLGPDPRLARLVLERHREAVFGDVRMNCDLCTYRVRLPSYEDKVGLPISLTPHGDAPARGKRRSRRATRAPQAPIELAPRRPGLRPAPAVAVPAGTPPALDVRGLRFAYPDGSPALAGVDLQVAQGERVAVLGPNGAGKTTLVLQLNGMLEGGEGTISVGGLELGPRTRAEVRRRVGIVFQDSDDQLFMPSVRADVAFGPANLGLRDAALRERVDAALQRVGLQDEADRAPHQLSAGQRRRAAVAGVLAMEPDVLILDEPSSAMDPAARRELADVLVSLRITTLVVTHDLPYALELCPRAVVLDRGVVVADGVTREVLSDEGFMRAHRLELPAGFNPLSA